ncbi:cyclic lactone autoinducer peptide [Acetivibrio cellulolyticus]|nr:cyclic lactone autoinducer peptide [Acetivibrio cellulolyticus]
MRRNLLGVVSAVLVIIAMVATSTASWFWLYQPKVPKSLHK